MSLPNIFTPPVSQMIVSRIDDITEQAQPLWGKMDAGQVLAHCNISHEMTYEDFHGRPNLPMRLMRRYLIKPKVCYERAYEKASGRRLYHVLVTSTSSVFKPGLMKYFRSTL